MYPVIISKLGELVVGALVVGELVVGELVVKTDSVVTLGEFVVALVPSTKLS